MKRPRLTGAVGTRRSLGIRRVEYFTADPKKLKALAELWKVSQGEKLEVSSSWFDNGEGLCYARTSSGEVVIVPDVFFVKGAK